MNWFRASLPRRPAVYFKSDDPVAAREIAKVALRVNSDIGLNVTAVDADQQPELLPTGNCVDATFTLAGQVTKKVRTDLFFARRF